MNNRQRTILKARYLQMKFSNDKSKQFAIDYLLDIRKALKGMLNEKDYYRCISSHAYADLKSTFKKDPLMARLFAHDAGQDYINCIISGIGNHPERVNFAYWGKLEDNMRKEFYRFTE